MSSHHPTSKTAAFCRYFNTTKGCVNPLCAFKHPTQQCRHWPNCTRGASCHFIHPINRVQQQQHQRQQQQQLVEQFQRQTLNPSTGQGQQGRAVHTHSEVKTVKQKQERKAFDITFVLDVSWSMSGTGFTQCIRGINSIVKGLRDCDRVSIRTFGNDVQDVLPPRSKSKHGGNRGIDRVLASVEVGGCTSLWDAVVSTIETRKPAVSDTPRARKIFILTDGDDNASHCSLDQVQRLVRAPGYAVHICMIAVTSGMSDDTEHTLRDLGGKNCCYQYRSVKDASSIGEGFKFFSDKVLKLEVVTERVVQVKSRTYTRQLTNAT